MTKLLLSITILSAIFLSGCFEANIRPDVIMGNKYGEVAYQFMWENVDPKYDIPIHFSKAYTDNRHGIEFMNGDTVLIDEHTLKVIETEIK